MSNNNNNNNNNNSEHGKQFSSVFAYWDTKDKRVAQSQRLNSFMRRPLNNNINNNNNNNNTNNNTSVVNKPTLSATVIDESVVPVTTSTSTATTSIPQDQPSTVPVQKQEEEEQQQEKVEINNNNNNVTVTEVSTSIPGYLNIPQQSNDVTTTTNKESSPDSSDNVLVGEDEPQREVSRSNYDNFNQSQPVGNPNPDDSNINYMVKRDIELSHQQQQQTSNYGSAYGSAYGSVYGTGYGTGGGGDYTDDGDVDDSYDPNLERDISQEKMLLLEILCERNSISYITGGDQHQTDEIKQQKTIAEETYNLLHHQNLLNQNISSTLAQKGYSTPSDAGLINNNNNNSTPTPTNYYYGTSLSTSSSSQPALPTNKYSHPSVLTNGSLTTSTSDEVLTSWNSEFQRLQEMDDCLEKFEKLSSLESDFVYAAESYGRIIISEHLLSNEHKTIKPVSVGGIAGGEKYIVQGILFKFAVESDTYGLYGSDENAAKTAAHELNGCTAFLNCGIKGLHVPLMAYIDYRGFRLMAMSLLPITKKTLVYGSSDAGQTVHTSNTMFNHLFTSAAKVLNLKAHVVEDAAGGELKTLYGPIDIEGHVGTDGRFYLLDFARLAPPEPPIHRGAYLYRHLRLEFVRTYEKALCSDSFSPMTPIGIESHNYEVSDAYNYLTNVHIPKVARRINQMGDYSHVDLSKTMHSEGLNIRMLGLIRRLSPVSETRKFLLFEAMVRTLKSLTRELLRREMKKTHLPSDYPYRKIILNFLNLLFGKSPATTQLLNDIVKPKMERKYKDIFKKPLYTLDEVEEDDVDGTKVLQIDYEIEEDPFEIFRDSDNFRREVFKGFINSIGLSISSECKQDFNKNSYITFVEPDILEMTTKIRRLNLIDYADGMALYYKSLLLEKTNSARNRLLSMSRGRLEQSLSSVSTNYSAVFQLGNVIRLMARLESGSSSIEPYKLAERTYASLEKLRVEQNFLYLAKVYRARTIVERAKVEAYSPDNYKNAIELLEEAEQLTSNKAKVLYYKGKALAAWFKEGDESLRSQEKFDRMVSVYNAVIADEPNYGKAYLALGELYLLYSNFHQLTDDQISAYYNKGLEIESSLVKNVLPSIEYSPWIFFSISKTSKVMKELVIDHFKNMEILRIPGSVAISEDHGEYFAPLTPTKVIYQCGKEPSVRNLLNFTKHISQFNLRETVFFEETFLHLNNIENLTSLNLGKTKGINDRCMQGILTPKLVKLKLFGMTELTDQSLRMVCESAPNLEVLDLTQCPGFTKDALNDIGKLTKLIKLGLPCSTTDGIAKYLLGCLPALKSLDLLECNSITEEFYGIAFGYSGSLKKFRGADAFPYFELTPQLFVIQIPQFRPEVRGSLGPDKIPLFNASLNVFGCPPNSKNIQFYVNRSHSYVKFRTHRSVAERHLAEYIKVSSYLITEKPIFNVNIQKVLNLTEFHNSENKNFKMMFTGNITKADITLNDIKYQISYQTLPSMHGQTFICSLQQNGEKLITISNTKLMKMGIEVQVHKPILSNVFAFILALCHPSINR